MRTILLTAALALAAVASAPRVAAADGCYICSRGSSANCKDYCRYSGSDTFAARKECEKKGCKVGGTASCPTAVNYKICSAPAPAAPTVAAAGSCSPRG